MASSDYGINYLIYVQKRQADYANQSASNAADAEKKIVDKEKILHDAQAEFENLVQNNNVGGKDSKGNQQDGTSEIQNLLNYLKTEGVISDSGLQGLTNGDYGDTTKSDQQSRSNAVTALRDELSNADKDLQAQDHNDQTSMSILMNNWSSASGAASQMVKQEGDTESGNAHNI
jgi:hypothetical protein